MKEILAFKVLECLSVFEDGKVCEPFRYYLSVAPEESCIEESCIEESCVEPEQDDDSIRVKIADLGNACWVVSVERDVSCKKLVPV